MDYIVFFVISFLLVYFIYFVFVIRRKKALKKLKTSLEVRYLTLRYKIDIEKMDLKYLAKKIALCNTFIVTIAFMIILFVKNFILKMLVGFVVLFPLILIGYYILGKVLKKKEGK